MKRFALLVTLAALGLTGQANAAPVLDLDLHHNQTNFTPGSTANYWVDVSNVGDTATSGPLTVTIELPERVVRQSTVAAFQETSLLQWSCPGSPGDSTIVCTTSDSLPRHAIDRELILEVDVLPGQDADVVATAKVEGGGAADVATAEEPTRIAAEQAGFGVLPASFVPGFFGSDAHTPTREAGAHPDLLTVPFDLTSKVAEVAGLSDAYKQPVGSLRDLVVDLPPGFIGAPTAVAECAQAEFAIGACPASSQVGRLDTALLATSLFRYTRVTVGVFNLAHPRGSVSDLGFVVAGNPVHIRASLDPANHYAIRSEVLNVNETLPPFSSKLTLWGVPADHSHDSERCSAWASSFATGGDQSTAEECLTDHKSVPFLTVPAQCESDNVMRLHHYDSWQESGVFGSEIDYTLPGKFTHCEKPRFEPEVEIIPTGKQANTPTGLDVHVKVAQNENPDALATPPVKRFTATLPEGMSFSPSFADGLKSCSLAQMQLGTNNPVECPDASRIGEVTLHTPLLPGAGEGSMYLAAQGDNPFGSTFALLLVLHDTEERGILVKIPGRIDVDGQTGQITTIFDDTPQFPFDDLTLKFRSGSRAPLVSPPTCGRQTIGIEVASYARPQEPVDASSTYDITEGPNGTSCPPDSAHLPFHPTFSGGTLTSSAGAYSPFLFRLNRGDDEQGLSQVSTVLPPGLVAKIAGVSLCPDSLIDSISTAEGAGAGELAHPACPGSSQIGTISAGLGAGPGPNYFPGKVYLAGPYKGAQLSLAVVAPGIAGPFDLGNVVVRAALYVNPDTTQVRAVSDPFPTILHGVILRVRDVRLRVDRGDTTINPTNCSPMSIDGQIWGTGGALFSVQSPFQVSDCASLSFKPKLSFRLFGGTHRGSHPKFRATLKMPPGGANIARVSVALPHSEFLDQGHIGTVCTRVQFAASACPVASIYGTVSAKTPLLDETLTGNVYLRSSSHQLPDLVAAFRGGRIDANLVGRIDSVNGGIRNTFDFVPDVPVTIATFSFFGGSKGLLVNSRDICKAPAKATAKFNGQNGAALTLHPELKSTCGKLKKKAQKHKREGRRQG